MKKQKKTHEHEKNEDNKDTFSDLPDCVLIHILSLLNVKEAVRTCILSSRWEYLWKHLPALTLYSSDFKTIKGFLEFVNGILSFRDRSTGLNALDFKCQDRTQPNDFKDQDQDRVQPHVLKSIVRYAASQNVNRLCLFFGTTPHGIRQFPSSLLSCRSLTTLDIAFQGSHLQFPNSLNLPALTYLKLRGVYFYTGKAGRAEPFSNLNRLNALIIYNCIVLDAKLPLCISSTTLLNLSMEYVSHFPNIELFAPSLCTFNLTCYTLDKLSGSRLSSIKQASIDVDVVMHPWDLLKWLVEVTNIKSLTITLTILQALSLIPDILRLKLSCLCNLESLKINLGLSSYFKHPWMTCWRDINLELANGKSWKENAMLQEIIKAGLEPIYSSIIDGMIEFFFKTHPQQKLKS